MLQEKKINENSCFIKFPKGRYFVLRFLREDTLFPGYILDLSFRIKPGYKVSSLEFQNIAWELSKLP